jgi:iron complex transport system ATP-binding protein
MALIEAKDLHVELSGKTILHGLSFELESGKWNGLLGPNGSGKTTLLRAIAGLIPYHGKLRLDGRETADWPRKDMARRVAFVRQTHAISFDFRVMDLVLLGRAPHKSLLSVYTDTDTDRVSAALSQLDLSGFEKRSFHSLSGGEQQRVFLAQALVQEADLLILDEPTTYLDVHHQFEFMEYVQTLVHEGRTVIGAVHDLEMAARFADHVHVLHRGYLNAAGSPSQVLTPELLASVFRMEAHVNVSPDQPVRIAYSRTLP